MHKSNGEQKLFGIFFLLSHRNICIWFVSILWNLHSLDAGRIKQAKQIMWIAYCFNFLMRSRDENGKNVFNFGHKAIKIETPFNEQKKNCFTCCRNAFESTKNQIDQCQSNAAHRTTKNDTHTNNKRNEINSEMLDCFCRKHKNNKSLPVAASIKLFHSSTVVLSIAAAL